MKKIITALISVAMAAAMLLSLGGCGDSTLVTKTSNGISLSVPSDYEEFKSNSSGYTAAGPDASITIGNPINVQTGTSADITQELIESQFSQKYTDFNITEFDNNYAIDGGTSVFIKYTGKAVSTGDNLDAYYLIFFASDNNAYHCFITYKSDSTSCSTAKYAMDIIKSIKLAA